MAGVVESGRDDDCIEYYLFFKEFVDAVPNPETEDVLRHKCSDVQARIASHVHQYIWHNEAFNVVTKSDTIGELLPPHLYGRTHFGDNIEDEWFIVFLLLELTKQMDGLVVRVVDNDGEFILIEAAEHLPSWAVPERCDRRVFLYQGEVHLIPIDETVPEPDTPSILEALNLILSASRRTKANPGIQQAIQSRIRDYPTKVKELLHQTHAYVPVGVAALLKVKPNLVAPAVMAFCNRDPLDAKVCRAMRFFPPENRVMRSVMFTKCLYAMILHHPYNPDKRSGWNIPPPNHEDYKSHCLGMKVACGFEILVAKQGKGMKASPDSDEISLTGNPRWLRYLESLKKYGYFHDLLEGSRDYCSLLEKAQSYFTSHYASEVESSYSHEILDLLQNTEYNIEDFKKEEETINPADNDSWLELNSRELDQMLEERYGTKKVSLGSSGSDIASHLSKFLNHISDIEGVEPPRETSNPEGKEKMKENVMDVEDGVPDVGTKINFDPDAFSCAVQNILDFVVPEDNWDLESDASSMSSYEHELDMDLDQLKRNGKRKVKTSESELKQYMDQMDRELAATTIGKSFEKSTKEGKTKQKEEAEDSFDEAENFKPVNIDLNAMKNILASYKAQMGGAGPSTNLLGPMGVRLEEDQIPANVPETGSGQ